LRVVVAVMGGMVVIAVMVVTGDGGDGSGDW
jgi:hypothetical protein